MFKGKPKRRKSEVRSIVHLFHGVEVLPGQGACAEVRELEGKRLLSEEAPMLPLVGCSQFTACTCRYRHFKDRRTESRRDSDDGLPPRYVEQERRSQSGRRVTDR